MIAALHVLQHVETQIARLGAAKLGEPREQLRRLRIRRNIDVRDHEPARLLRITGVARATRERLVRALVVVADANRPQRLEQLALRSGIASVECSLVAPGLEDYKTPAPALLHEHFDGEAAGLPFDGCAIPLERCAAGRGGIAASLDVGDGERAG